tara:strand:+ start:2524 stop:3174 length:651 start_codon:yes stop_codon:yes gene_type:complete
MAQVIGKRVSQAERIDAVKIPHRARRQPRFLFKWHPHRWLFTGKEWLPSLGKMYIDPGVDGVSENGGTDLAVASNLRRGWQVIQPSDPRLGEYQDYLVAVPHAAGGNSYIDPFQTISVEAGRMFVEEGGEKYHAFLRHLLASGVVAPMSPNILKVKLHDEQKRVERLQGAVAANPANQIAASRLKQAEERIAAMRAATEPKAARKPRKKAEAHDVG